MTVSRKTVAAVVLQRCSCTEAYASLEAKLSGLAHQAHGHGRSCSMHNDTCCDGLQSRVSIRRTRECHAGVCVGDLEGLKGFLVCFLYNAVQISLPGWSAERWLGKQLEVNCLLSVAVPCHKAAGTSDFVLDGTRAIGRLPFQNSFMFSACATTCLERSCGASDLSHGQARKKCQDRGCSRLASCVRCFSFSWSCLPRLSASELLKYFAQNTHALMHDAVNLVISGSRFWQNG